MYNKIFKVKPRKCLHDNYIKMQIINNNANNLKSKITWEIFRIVKLFDNKKYIDSDFAVLK